MSVGYNLRSSLVDRFCLLGAIGFGGSLDQAAILDFVDSGHDLIIAADANASDLMREIATECGVDFDEVYFTLCFFSDCYYDIVFCHLKTFSSNFIMSFLLCDLVF